MKYKIALVFTVLLMLPVCMACGKDSNGNKSMEFKVSEEEAKEQISLFFEAVESEDYAAAEELLHPDESTSVSELFIALEAGLNLDFQEGIDIVSYENTSSQNGENGTSYTTDVEIMVGEASVCVVFEIMRNENGFGIYSYTFAF